MSATPSTKMIASRRRPVVVLVLALASLCAAGAKQRPVPIANANPTVTINVDAALNVHPIDPRIYGVAFADPLKFDNLGITINRWGGNAVSRHNWFVNTTNRAKDYFFENQPDAPAIAAAGTAADDFIAPTLVARVDAIMTIPMMGMLPFDNAVRCGYSVANDVGCCRTTDPIRPDCGDGRHATDYDPKIFNYRRLKGVNDVTRTTLQYPASHQGDWVQHMVDTHKTVAHPNGVRYYALDNEPSLWSFDHWDVHPNGPTTDEVWGKMAEYGALIKAKDPNALITGVEEWGWDGYFYSGLDQENYGTPQFGNDQAAHGGIPYARWLLQQSRDYEQANGTRILDFFTLHFYPQNGEFCCPADPVSLTMQGFRNRSTRALWDPSYVDESYIGGNPPGTGLDGGKVRLIPRLREWANNDYPGTKTGITEYNWGAESHINGATAQADILGIFGREGLDLGVRWKAPPTDSLTYNAIKMYRNYDGAGSKFGDMSVDAGGPNPDDVATFAAIRSADSKLTVMIVAKNAGIAYDATVNLANFNATGPAERWQLDSGNAITKNAIDVPVANSQLLLTVPAQSITLLVIPGQYQQAPSGLVATWISTPQGVVVQWNAVAGAISYEVFRKGPGAGPFVFLGPPVGCGPLASCDQTTALLNSYIYKVRAVGAGSIKSGFSNIDVATTVTFTDDPFPTVTNIKAVHITELQTAVTAMRYVANLNPPQVFQPVAAGGGIKAEHIRELRRGLNQARAVLELPPVTYTDPAINPNGVPIRKQHIVDLRDGVK